MTALETERNRAAQELFAPIAASYDRYANLLSFGQDPRWRRFLAGCIDVPADSRVLDVATGTAAVAIELTRRTGCTVVGIDQSADMLAEARRRVETAALEGKISLEAGRAEALPFATGEFDGLTFTYLLRYVDDPTATLRELARVVRAGAPVASLEFAVPKNPLARAAWRAYTAAGLPILGGFVSRGWRDVGRFLGPSIRDFDAEWPVERVVETWLEAGFENVRSERLSLGGGVVIWGTRGSDSLD
ncbi:MAG: class I SAM-dependent methyltransferase [Gaiellaceae bacterium]